MRNAELIHSDFETINREDQNYRISTRVEYEPDHSRYRCKAVLFRSYNGRILDVRRDKMHKRLGYTSEKSEIDTVLEECIESCRTKLDEIEYAKDVTVDVEIGDK